MKLAQGPFEKIAAGKKNIESRLYDEKRKQINVGDFIEFSQNEDLSRKVKMKVRGLYLYKTFDELFSDFAPENFGGESKEGLLQEIHQFYSLDDENKFGVVGIRMEKE